MASNSAKSGKFKRLESRKSHSWWWDSHISPKNSKWLQDNLEEMDVHIKRMLKLIEEDADSFAKKAEMYFQKRPELLHLVEEFYRMYRSLAERYDNVTGELRKNIPSDLHSQGSGVSDVGSEPPSTIPSPDRRPIHRKQSGPRAAGFDVFLGSGGSDMNSKEDDGSSTLDSESDSDDSSVNNYLGNGEDQGLRRRINELEAELKEVKEKLQVHEDEVPEGSLRLGDENVELRDKIISYEEEFISKEKIQASEEEITELTIELQKFKALVDSDDLSLEDVKGTARELPESIDLEGEGFNENKIEEELRIAQEKLNDSEKKVWSLQEILTGKDSSIESLQDQVKSAQKEVSEWKNKLEKEKREVSKLQDRIARYKTSLSERDQEIRGLKESINNANKILSEENENLKAEMTKLLKEQAYLEDSIKEMDLRRQSLEEELRRAVSGKTEIESVLGAEIDQLKTDIAEKNESITELRNNLVREVNLKNDEINEMSQHLHELHIEHVKLISGAERARKYADELVLKVEELEKEVERKEKVIIEAGEEKREAIRQLCFSIEHYRDGYDRLRQVVTGHRRMLVTAS